MDQAYLTRAPALQAMRALREHWPEYLMEAWGLGMFMVSAGLFATLLEFPGSPLHQAIADADLRRFLIGLAMGLTAIGIIYSPWGKQSGAHLNPAVTLTFLRLGKVKPWDAFYYILAQFVGGTLGVLLVALTLGAPFTAAPVTYAVTLPGGEGAAVAFGAEFVISFGMMLMVLIVSNHERLARYTGVFAGILVAAYITFEAPLSGMSMNPARSFASAAPGSMWQAFWIYLFAPVLGMLSAAWVYPLLRRREPVHCAKLIHADEKRCIHCGYDPPAS